MNWAQLDLWNDPHPCKIILKARQLGITTYFCILHLDKVLWNPNIQAGIIAHTRDDASYIFKDKLKYAFDNLHPLIRPLFKINSDSSTELSFSHGSVIRVGTSLRSSTLQYLHISEFGKICSKYPEKALEVVTGALQTVSSGQSIVIESTAEGNEGYFFDMCQLAFSSTSRATGIQYSPHFFPWYKEETYALEMPPHTTLSEIIQKEEDRQYFDKLSVDGINLSDEQKYWYLEKKKVLNEEMCREYPSTPQEAFAASQEGYWYASNIKELWDKGQIKDVSYDKALPVHCSWDLGQADMTSIWFFQVNRSDDINIIDFWQKNNTPIEQISMMLKSKGYSYGSHIWPHDANARDRAGVTFLQQCRPFGLNGIVLEPHGFIDGVNKTRTFLSKCWFDRTKCQEGIKMLQNYKKKWNSSYGGYSSEPVHDGSSHAADSFRYLACGINKISSSNSLSNDFSALRKFWG